MDGKTEFSLDHLIWRTIYGFLLGILVFFQFVEYHSTIMLGKVVGVSIFTSMSVAYVMASILPIILEK